MVTTFFQVWFSNYINNIETVELFDFMIMFQFCHILLTLGSPSIGSVE